MGITKSDFMRGMQCPRMLWLDRHHPEVKIIPPQIRERLNRGSAFGDRMMGIFGPYVEVREFYPGTSRPNRKEMVRKTRELLDAGTPVICEAAFMDSDGDYCAADILRRNEDGSCDLYEVKDSTEVSGQHIRDAGFQACLIRKAGLTVRRVFLIYHGKEPYDIRDVTEETDALAAWVEENLPRLRGVKEQEEEVCCATGEQCSSPYTCWYVGYCSLGEAGELEKPRCSWCSLGNPLYVRYHDTEWGVPCHDDHDLYELLILESFQAGLSWEIVLNKRENFRVAYDGFDLETVSGYGDEKIEALLNDKGIVRNRLKIRASVRNSRVFREIQTEFGTFDRYIWGFTKGETIRQEDPAVTSSPLSDEISRDLTKRGMTFVGTTIIYSYLQAIGVIDAHEKGCFRYKGGRGDVQNDSENSLGTAREERL